MVDMIEKTITMDELEEELRHDKDWKGESFVPAQGTPIQKEEYPDTHPTKGGIKVLDTVGNLLFLLRRFGVSVRWNLMRRYREIIIPNETIFKDDEENSALALVINLAILNHMPINLIDSHLDVIGQRNAYHPIVESMKAFPWDGKLRLESFIQTVQTKNNPLSHKLIRRWMIGAIAAAHSESGIALQGALVLQGKQYIGKTQWVKSLDPIKAGAVFAGSLLDPTNKDCLIAISRHWLVELGELDGTFNKSDIARIKGYITNDCDEIRLPYARKSTRVPRRSAFVATVNESKYLVDTTGNRRWWTIPVLSIDLEHGLDMQQVWAEVHSLWINGESTKLDQDEFKSLNIINSDFEKVDPLEEKLLMMFDFTDRWQERRTFQRTASQVLYELKFEKPTQGECNRMSSLLQKLTGMAAVRNMKGRFFTVPSYRLASEMQD